LQAQRSPPPGITTTTITLHHIMWFTTTPKTWLGLPRSFLPSGPVFPTAAA
jgi:hypothetical protein